MRLAKQAMNRVEFLPLKEAYRIEQDYTGRMLAFEDSTEARDAVPGEARPRLQVALTGHRPELFG